MITYPFLISIIILCVVLLTIQKEYTAIPLIVAMCFLPADQKIQILTLDFQAIRILAIVGIIKIYSTANTDKIELNIIDKLFISYNLFGSFIYVIASQSPVNAFIYKGGVFIDSILLYFVFRYSISSKETLILIVKTFSICLLILAPFVILEYFTAINLFSFLGRNSIKIRHDEIRAAATFSHPILFGSFAVALFSLLWADYKIKKSLFKFVALCCCIFFIYACSSSGPIAVFIVILGFLFFFQWKNHSKLLSWAILTGAIFIHFIREKPLWHFFYMRLTIKASSTGEHRYRLAEAAIQEFWSWWLLGYGDAGPDWHSKYWPWNHAKFTDVTNQYILEGVRGGFFTMFLFILLCYNSLKTLGSLSISQKDIKDQWLYWGFTAMMISHCVTFLSVAYFGQMTMLLFITIAVASFAYEQSHVARYELQKDLQKT